MNQGSFEPVFFACGPSWGNDSDEEKVGLATVLTHTAKALLTSVLAMKPAKAMRARRAPVESPSRRREGVDEKAPLSMKCRLSD